ncbi:DEAD/DEAH box helicase [Thermococcus gammatolerans]|uniref:DNA repair helicase, XPB-rad25-like protein n=1 Tax=Thermococcus gammatolerans (strain DSM 15229 / JCM 11827 / EJ3) TaxID=593117 RepID=C5A7E8_THEGJ|nr:DEAD/DEAH box helicase [Thermococcus gammatolerans]ACS34160.1 DNA repair helicase, XPB-rad25 -like protein [Thermococcus gammatolerans EJ3]
MVVLRIPDGSALVRVEKAEPSVYFKIYDLLTYKKDYGKWEKPESLYDPYEKTFPVGLLPRVKKFLNSKGYRVRVKDERQIRGTKLNSTWNENYSLRRYQQRAVRKALREKMGVLALPVGSGKTVVGLRIIHELDLSALIVVHTKELLYQWAEKVEELLGVKAGIVGDNKWNEENVTVAMIQTLLSRGADKLNNDYAIVMFDECHRTSAAEKFYQLGISLPQVYRFGLSATPWRRVRGEEIKIEAVVGPIIYEVKAEDLIREGFLAKPRFEVITYESRMPSFSERYKELYEDVIMNNEERNRAIVAKAKELVRKGHRVLIDVKRIEHGKILKEMLDREGVKAEFLSSQSPNRWEVLEAYKNGEIPVLISTLLKEGVDIPEISAIILAGGGKSDIMTIQTIGRALRPKWGMKAVIVDVADDDPLLYTHFIERQKALKQYYGRYYDRESKLNETVPKKRRARKGS